MGMVARCGTRRVAAGSLGRRGRLGCGVAGRGGGAGQFLERDDAALHVSYAFAAALPAAAANVAEDAHSVSVEELVGDLDVAGAQCAFENLPEHVRFASGGGAG